MGKGRKIGKRILSLGAVLAALSTLLVMGAPAEAMPASPAEGPLPAPERRELRTEERSVPSPPPEAQPLPAGRPGPAAPAEDAAEPAEPEKAHPGGDRARMPEAEVAEDAAAAEAPPVEDAYFDDAVFLGDSRTEGFFLYSGLDTGTYFYAVGATVWSVFETPAWKTEAGKVPLLDAMAEQAAGKVYVMLGVNELGWPDSGQFQTQYGAVIDRIRADHPEAKIAVQSILPVSAAQEAKGTYVNNARIREFNALLEDLARERGCVYLNVAEAVTGEDGCLKSELTGDGVHLNTAGCGLWLEYLRTHPL